MDRNWFSAIPRKILGFLKVLQAWSYSLVVLLFFFALFDVHTPRSLASGARTHNSWGRTRTNTAEWRKQNVPAGCGMPRADSGWLLRYSHPELSGYSVWYISVISFMIILEIDGISIPCFEHFIGWVSMKNMGIRRNSSWRSYKAIR